MIAIAALALAANVPAPVQPLAGGAKLVVPVAPAGIVPFELLGAAVSMRKKPLDADAVFPIA